MTAPDPAPIPTAPTIPAAVAAEAGRHAERVTAEATPYTPPEAPTGAVTDDTPALAGILPEQTPDENFDGVDLTTMPGFRSLQGQLPAARFLVKVRLAELEKMIPNALRDTDGTPDESQVLDSITEVGQMFQQIQDLVLDLAADRDAMTEWLVAQKEGENALMAAFGKLSDDLGN